MIKHTKLLLKYKFGIIILFFSLLFSTWLMWSTFSYENGSMQIATKAWSDFASHIPLIRSFSFGNNFPPQYPLFPGSAIKYHFLFYAIVGLLEKIGLRIDYALNIPSILGFTFLTVMIYVFGKEIFKSKIVGVLSVLFFLFNSSLDFINFFVKHPLSTKTFTDIITNNSFPSFGPYDGKIISAFWNLNIYTNQRHLAISYALSLLIIYVFLKMNNFKKNKTKFSISLLIGALLGFSFMLNMAVFLMTCILLICLFFLYKEKRLYILITLLISAIIALPQYLYINSSPSIFKYILHYGYLVENLNVISFVNYWWQNLGINLILIPLAFLIGDKNQRKIILAFFSLFIVGNVIQFSPEIAANHKFFNFFIIVGGMYSAFVLLRMWKKHILKPLVLILFFLMILSGTIDFFPIANDGMMVLADYPVSKDVAWIIKNTKPDAVFLNTNYLYDNASLAGRKIFVGWPYFAWSQGYNTEPRDRLRLALLATNDFVLFCKSAGEYKINYIELSSISSDITLNKSFFDKNFIKVYSNNQSDTTIYAIGNKCF